MKLVTDQKHIDIIAATNDVLVTGGPGSGKTTVALLKAQARSRTLEPGQQVLFLSFTRSAIRQILMRCGDVLTSAERKLIQVKTYHHFCLETLSAHGPLLCARQVRFLYPSDERLRKSTFDGDWETERIRLSAEEGLFCFDLVAPAVAELFARCSSVRTLYADKHPLVIVDEFQDTDDDQWSLVQAFLEVADVCCLADPEQRIFEYRSNVDPRRIEALCAQFNPTVFDLGGDNHRSPATGILQFADAILHNRAPLPNTRKVSTVLYSPNTFDSTTHAAVIWTLSKLYRDGSPHPSIAVLCRSNAFVARLSAILVEEHTFQGRTLSPVDHDVLWDADLSAAAAQIVGSILEWPVKDTETAVHDTARLIAHYYRIKNAGSPSNSATENARKFDEAAVAFIQRKPPRINAAKAIILRARTGLALGGNPVNDWREARHVLQEIKPLNELFREARLVRLFRATDALGSGLSGLWLDAGHYAGAASLVKRILDAERLHAADRDPRGCALMTIHKAKAREFDGVVLVEGAFASQFFDAKRERPPFEKSRRLLRVGITRARSYVTIVRPRDAPSLVDEHT